MRIQQFEIWIADLNQRAGTEPGKTRPVLIVQTDLLEGHPSTIICPITAQIIPNADILRVHLKKNTGRLRQDCDIMIDQLRAIDNVRLKQKIGTLPSSVQRKVKENLRIVLDLD